MLLDKFEYELLERAVAPIENCTACDQAWICYDHAKALCAALERFFMRGKR